VTAALVGGGFPGVDSITIGAETAPGQWVLMPCSKVFGWQIQQGYALSGATVFPKGDELLVAPFLIKLWDPDDYPLFVAFAAKYLKKAVFSPGGGFTAFALGIGHPELARLGVTSVVVQKSPVLTQNERRLWSGVVEFLQYRKPKPALGKPNASIPSASTPKPIAQDAQDVAIQQRQAALAAARGP
jgi:hypothetical protein